MDIETYDERFSVTEAMMDDKTRQAFASRLRTVREKQFPGHGGQADCAHALGVPKSTWASYENGDREPPYALVERLCLLCGCSTANTISGFGKIAGPDDPDAANAIAEAVEEYGRDSRVGTIRGAAMDVLLRWLNEEREQREKIEAENKQLRYDLRKARERKHL